MHLVLDQTDPQAFEHLATELTPMLRKVAAPFVKDNMLSRLEDIDSLVNLCLVKLHQAYRNFKYEKELTEEHNQRRFLAMVKKYVVNILIDQQYLANLKIRKPDKGLVSTAQMLSEDSEEEFQVRAVKQPTPQQIAVANELESRLFSSLDDESSQVASLLLCGFPAEAIARRLGKQISRVRYLIYSRIQPAARECCV